MAAAWGVGGLEGLECVLEGSKGKQAKQEQIANPKPCILGQKQMDLRDEGASHSIINAERDPG